MDSVTTELTCFEINTSATLVHASPTFPVVQVTTKLGTPDTDDNMVGTFTYTARGNVVSDAIVLEGMGVFEGRIGSWAGTVWLKFTERISPDPEGGFRAQGELEVVPGSGTGDFAALRAGVMKTQAEGPTLLELRGSVRGRVIRES